MAVNYRSLPIKVMKDLLTYMIMVVLGMPDQQCGDHKAPLRDHVKIEHGHKSFQEADKGTIDLFQSGFKNKGTQYLH